MTKEDLIALVAALRAASRHKDLQIASLQNQLALHARLVSDYVPEPDYEDR